MLDQSLWRAEPLPRFASAPLPKEVDVVVVGAGITGLTTAYLLKRSGKSVAVFERDHVGSGESGSTSAHVTYVTDARISELESHFGADGAQLTWRSLARAIDLIESIADREAIACHFRRVPGFLCMPFFPEDEQKGDRTNLRDDVAIARNLGFAARFVEHGPITGKSAISFADQAVFHPLEYLAGLASAVDGGGSFVREQCEVGDVIQDPLAVVVNGETIACKDLVIATHVPMVGIRSLVGATLFQTKLYPYSTYVLGARAPANAPPPGLYFDTADPYNYLRIHEDEAGRYAIFGGKDHKTGQQSDTEGCYAKLIADFQRLFPTATIERRWSGQVVESEDGLPFIGTVAEHQHIATGYAGNGLTFGTVAGMMMHDTVLGQPNPYSLLYDPHRKAASTGAISRLVSENVDYPFHYIADRLHTGGQAELASLPRGGGRVLTLDGQRVAVHRRENGTVVKVSAVCTHMGCLVRWNNAERTWDCPCHGSRFTAEGLVIGGPAEAPLDRIDG